MRQYEVETVTRTMEEHCLWYHSFYRGLDAVFDPVHGRAAVAQ